MQVEVHSDTGFRETTIGVFFVDIQEARFRLLTQSQHLWEQSLNFDCCFLSFPSQLGLDQVWEGFHLLDIERQISFTRGGLFTSGHASCEGPRACQGKLGRFTVAQSLVILHQTLKTWVRNNPVWLWVRRELHTLHLRHVKLLIYRRVVASKSLFFFLIEWPNVERLWLIDLVSITTTVELKAELNVSWLNRIVHKSRVDSWKEQNWRKNE